MPVETPAMGTLPHSDTTTRCVPSPPSTMMAATSMRRMRRAAEALSAAWLVTFICRKLSSGNRASPALFARIMARLKCRRMPAFSGIITTSSTPAAARPARIRSTILARSVICRLPACAMMRRISRADTGFAMMPTTGPGTLFLPHRDMERNNQAHRTAFEQCSHSMR